MQRSPNYFFAANDSNLLDLPKQENFIDCIDIESPQQITLNFKGSNLQQSYNFTKLVEGMLSKESQRLFSGEIT